MTVRALVLGLVSGVLLTVTHRLLPDQWAVLAGTSALWGVVSLVAGRRLGERTVHGAAAGLTAMVGVLIPWLAIHAASTPPAELALWMIVGPVAGAICGAAGAMSRMPGRRGALAAGVVPGIVGGEAVYGLLLIGGPAWGLESVLAAGLLVVVSRRGGRLCAFGSAAVLVALAAAACLVYDSIL